MIRVPVLMRHKKAVASMASMASYVIKGIKTGLELIGRERFDVVNTHFVLPTGPVGDVLSRSAGVPNVLSLHGGDLYDPSKRLSPHRHTTLRWMVRALLRRATVIVGQSCNTLDNMRSIYAPDIEGIRIPLAIRRPQPVDARRIDFGFSEHELILTTIGRLVPRKAIDQLIRMMVNFRNENVRLVIIGTGPEEKELRRQAAEAGIQNQVTFTGFVSEIDKFRLLSLSDAFVSTSQHEGFGIVYLESMACGLPIICYDEGGQTDFLENNKTGYLVPLNDLNQFTARCRELIQSAGLRSEIGATNRQVVENYFIDRCAGRYERVFEDAVKRYAALQPAIMIGQGTS